jgi:hypothetical protein
VQFGDLLRQRVIGEYLAGEVVGDGRGVAVLLETLLEEFNQVVL